MTKFLRRLRLLAAEDKKREPGDKRRQRSVTLIQGAYSRLRSISFEARRRRVLPEASPRFTSRLRLEEVEHGVICASAAGHGRRAVLLVGVDDGADQLVPNDVAVVEINERDSRAHS